MEEKPITKHDVYRVLGHLKGRKGKGKTSPAKAAAARENGKKGGRPRKAQLEIKLTP